MARWALNCAGDLLAPLVTASAIALGHSYRAAMAAVGVAVLVQCLASCAFLILGSRSPAPPAPAVAAASEPDTTAEPLRAAVRRAARMPRLRAWLVAAASCTLLDELIVALAARALPATASQPRVRRRGCRALLAGRPSRLRHHRPPRASRVRSRLADLQRHGLRDSRWPSCSRPAGGLLPARRSSPWASPPRRTTRWRWPKRTPASRGTRAPCRRSARCSSSSTSALRSSSGSSPTAGGPPGGHRLPRRATRRRARVRRRPAASGLDEGGPVPRVAHALIPPHGRSTGSTGPAARRDPATRGTSCAVQPVARPGAARMSNVLPPAAGMNCTRPWMRLPAWSRAVSMPKMRVMASSFTW